MLEVCFNDSVKGALSLAQHGGRDNIGGAFGIITDKKWPFSYFLKRKALKEYKIRQRQLKEQAVALGGTRDDLVGLSFVFSEGDIRAPLLLNGCPRKDVIEQAFSFDRYQEKEDMGPSIENFWRLCIADLEKIKASPKKIRIWLDQSPDAQCGLLFVCDLLKDSATSISVVSLPETIGQEDGTTQYRGWGDVDPELFGTFLSLEKALTTEDALAFSKRWQTLKEENAPLRVVEQGRVISAQEDYYDDLIRSQFPKESCSVAMIIGRALGKQHILTGDVFIAKRIMHLIASKELRVLSHANDGFYATIVSCSKG